MAFPWLPPADAVIIVSPSRSMLDLTPFVAPRQFRCQSLHSVAYVHALTINREICDAQRCPSRAPFQAGQRVSLQEIQAVCLCEIREVEMDRQRNCPDKRRARRLELALPTATCPFATHPCESACDLGDGS